MAEYTIELKDVVETHRIFDFAYPFYNEDKRPDFERAFIRHFYFREIGCETIDRFKHYLEDKFITVFPYYNELFKAAEIEYSILDNYKLEESYTIKREQTGKANAVSSTVGQLFDSQKAESSQDRVIDNEGKTVSVGKDTLNDVSNSVTNDNGISQTAGDVTKSNNSKLDKKYLETPQGLTDLTDANYITTLHQDLENATGTEISNTASNSHATSETESNRDSVTDSTNNVDVTGKETLKGSMLSESEQQSRSTNDNNTRTESKGEQTETYNHTKVGNIGIDTDSDMITKHIRLQKTLRSIEKMFFNECEDLFMLVY